LKRFLEPLVNVVNIRYIGIKAVLGIFLGRQRLSDNYLSAMSSGSEYRRLLGGFYQKACGQQLPSSIDQL